MSLSASHREYMHFKDCMGQTVPSHLYFPFTLLLPSSFFPSFLVSFFSVPSTDAAWEAPRKRKDAILPHRSKFHLEIGKWTPIKRRATFHMTRRAKISEAVCLLKNLRRCFLVCPQRKPAVSSSVVCTSWLFMASSSWSATGPLSFEFFITGPTTGLSAWRLSWPLPD